MLSTFFYHCQYPNIIVSSAAWFSGCLAGWMFVRLFIVLPWQCSVFFLYAFLRLCSLVPLFLSCRSRSACIQLSSLSLFILAASFTLRFTWWSRCAFLQNSFFLQRQLIQFLILAVHAIVYRRCAYDNREKRAMWCVLYTIFSFRFFFSQFCLSFSYGTCSAHRPRSNIFSCITTIAASIRSLHNSLLSLHNQWQFSLDPLAFTKNTIFHDERNVAGP